MYCQTYFIVKDAKDQEGVLEYCEMSKADMRGNIPVRLMNMVLTGETSKQFREMYNHLRTKFCK